MSPFRILLPFAIAGVSVWNALANPNRSTAWYAVAAISLVGGVVRLIKYQKAKSQPGPGSDPPA